LCAPTSRNGAISSPSNCGIGCSAVSLTYNWQGFIRKSVSHHSRSEEYIAAIAWVICCAVRFPHLCLLIVDTVPARGQALHEPHAMQQLIVRRQQQRKYRGFAI
jgi:hypothetical protein